MDWKIGERPGHSDTGPLHAELEGFVIPLGFANALSAALVHTENFPAQGDRVSHHLAKAMPAQPFFQVPTVEDNEDGWGPTTVPQQLEGIPYAPFSKGEKVSKISDFTGSGFNRFGGDMADHSLLCCVLSARLISLQINRTYRSRQRPRSGRSCVQLLPQRRSNIPHLILSLRNSARFRTTAELCSNALTLLSQEDSFHLVDNKPAAKNKGQRRFNPQRFAHRNTQFSRGQPEQPHQARQKQQKQRQFQNFHRDNQRV